ncbi:MAG: 16S rRNA (uracil(1498)-N(3))-methyltransferase [Thermodesulfovibrionales bacterium]|nr:16S rRNA (uracil(1498)-N(3))-methyltransferase [Thermodesulfovibrionales bacterium]
MPRIYLPVKNREEHTITITGEKAHYLITVLRCRKGDEIIIFDGSGHCYKTRIEGIERKVVLAEVTEQFPCGNEPSVRITLVVGLLKGEKMDMVIQKATELGVYEIIPVVNERSQIRETRKISRWKKIAEEASRQSGRSIVPEVREAVQFIDLLKGRGARVQGQGFLFYEGKGAKFSEAVASLPRRPSCLFIMVGPEGGFTQEEITLAQAQGAILTTLGKRILRAETASLAALSIVQFQFGGMD